LPVINLYIQHDHKRQFTDFVFLGAPASHDEAKALLAGFTGAFIDREAETRGLDFIDREKAKRHAQQQAEQGLSDSGSY